jgi:RNA polymerase primary sigma factor
MSMPSMKPQSPSARPRDRRFYQPIRLPQRDSARPGTPDDPAAEPTGARTTADGPVPRLRIFGEEPTGHGLDGHVPRPGTAPEGEPVAPESLAVTARRLPRAAPIRQTTEQPLRSSPGARRASLAARASRLLDARLEFVDHPSFDDPEARDTILGPSPEPGGGSATRRGKSPETLRPPPAGFCDAPLLSREQEAHLFRKMNYLKSLARRLRDRIDPARARAAELDEIERLLREAVTVRNRIVEANQRLVVSIAKKHLRPGDDLFERVSDGNYVMIRAVELFDYSRGNKFSTYATWAIRNQFAQAFRARRHCQPQFVLGHDEASELAVDPRTDDLEQLGFQEQRQEAIARLLDRLDDRERRILVGHFGIGGARVQTLKQIGQELGISKERVRQIKARAQEKLRGLARTEEFDLWVA